MVINPNKISIDFKDTPYAKESGASVQIARDGSISNYGIEYTKDCAVQKEMDSNMIYTGTTQNEIVSDVAKNLPENNFDPADFISQSINGEDAKDIEDEGTILEEYVDSTLERAIEKVKTERKTNAEALGKQVEKEKERETAEAKLGEKGNKGKFRAVLKILFRPKKYAKNMNAGAGLVRAALYAFYKLVELITLICAILFLAVIPLQYCIPSVVPMKWYLSVVSGVWSITLLLLSRMFRIAAIEVDEVKDNNYLFGLFTAVTSIVSAIVSIIALVK